MSRPERGNQDDIPLDGPAEDGDYYLASLTPDEKTARALSLAAVAKELLDLRAERAEVNKALNARIKSLERRSRDLIESVNTGQERRTRQLDLAPGFQDESSSAYAQAGE